MEKSPLRGNNSRGIALNQIIGGTSKRNTTGSGSSTSVTYQSVNKKVTLTQSVKDNAISIELGKWMHLMHRLGNIG